MSKKVPYRLCETGISHTNMACWASTRTLLLACGLMHICLPARTAQAKEILVDESNNDFDELDAFDVGNDGAFPERQHSDTITPARTGKEIRSIVAITHCPTLPVAKVVTEFSARMQHVYKDISVEEIPEESPQPMQHLSSVATVSQYAMMAYCWAGRKISAQLGLPVPGWYGVIEQSPMTPVAVLYFLGRRLQNYILGTGGFEVTLNGKPVWSMRESGRAPSWQELLFQLQEAGLPHIDGADDESKFPSGWQEKKDEAATQLLERDQQ